MAVDLILYNADVRTMDRRQPRAELVAVEGQRIAAVGGNDALAGLCGSRTRVIDCQAKALLPGFIDAHLHLFSYAASLLAVDCSPARVRSLPELQDRLRGKAAELPSDAWVRATGYDEFSLTEKRHPTRYDLDAATPDHPVKLTHRSGHAIVLNSLALRLAGITRDTPEPADGVIERDLETGEPTGVLFEMADFLDRRIPPLSQRELEEGVRLASRRLLAQGVTSVHDATPDWSLERFDLLRGLVDRGIFAPRVYKMVGHGALPELRRRGLSFGWGDHRLRLGAIKFMLHETTGSLQPPQAVLNRQALEAHRAGFPLAFHAVEQGTVQAVARAIEHILARSPGPPPLPPRIEHCSVCPPRLLERLRRLGVTVVTNPGFLYHSGDRYLATVLLEQRAWLYRIRSFFRAGLRPAAGSDAPVTPPSPLTSMHAAVTRRARAGQALLPSERVTLRQALAMHTVHAAAAAGEEGDKGSLAPGKLADLVLVEGLEGKGNGLLRARVALVVLGGEVVHRRL